MNQPRVHKQSISAFVICFNEERNIRRCLESIRWCDEIVVIDSGSSDRTLEICSEYTRKIMHHPWSGFVKQKRYGLEHCSGDWVFNLDADEEVSSELRDEIVGILNAPPTPENGFEVLRVVFYLGKWWRRGGWYPEYRLRVLRRSIATWAGEDPHEKAEIDGPTRRLRGELRHYTYANITEQIRALNSHSAAAAESLAARGQRSSMMIIVIRPIARFIKFYIFKKGFLEGFAGFVVAGIEAFYVFLKYVKLWEKNLSR